MPWPVHAAITGIGNVNRRSASAPPDMTSVRTSSGEDPIIILRSNPPENRSGRPISTTALASFSAVSSAALSEATMVGLMALALPSSMVMRAMSFSIFSVAVMDGSCAGARLEAMTSGKARPGAASALTPPLAEEIAQDVAGFDSVALVLLHGRSPMAGLLLKEALAVEDGAALGIAGGE